MAVGAMSAIFRKYALPLVVALVSVTVYFQTIGKRVTPTDCEMAQFFYPANAGNSFQSFLENQFRVYGVLEAGGLFSDSSYSFAIYHPNKASNKYKGYEYLVSRSGVPHSRKAISISEHAWQRGSRAECESKL